MARNNSLKTPSSLKISRAKVIDHPEKSILKAVSWRIVGTIDTIIISYLITGKFIVAISIGSIEVFTKLLLYYLHERVWEHLPRRISVSRIIRHRFIIFRRRITPRTA